MDTKHFKHLLLNKERDLSAHIARSEADARDSRESEVQDAMDQVISGEAKAVLFQESTLEWTELEQVRDALRRIEQGTYGKCVDCGRVIETARLEAVPWTPYCLADQKNHD